MKIIILFAMLSFLVANYGCHDSSFEENNSNNPDNQATLTTELQSLDVFTNSELKTKDESLPTSNEIIIIKDTQDFINIEPIVSFNPPLFPSNLQEENTSELSIGETAITTIKLNSDSTVEIISTVVIPNKQDDPKYISGDIAIIFFTSNTPSHIYTYENPLKNRSLFLKNDISNETLDVSEIGFGYINLKVTKGSIPYTGATIYQLPSNVYINTEVTSDVVEDIIKRGLIISEIDIEAYYQSFPVIFL